MKTKAFYTGILALLFTATISKAQLGSLMGVIVGPSFSTFYGDGAYSDLNMHGGYAAGIVYQYAFSSMYALHTGLFYESKGTSLESNVGLVNVRNRYNLNYIALPILFRVHLMPDKRVRPFINAGPYLGYLMQEKTVVRNSDNNDVISRTPDTEHYNRFDVGVSGGAGLDFLIGSRMHLDFEVRDNVGLYNVNPNNTGKVYNNSINFLVATIFNIP